MSCYQVTTKGGVKFMHPVSTAEEYRKLRHSLRQMQLVRMARKGTLLKLPDGTEVSAKTMLVQMNYSCLPADDAGHLKGSTHLSCSVGMDIDLHRADFPTDEAYEQRVAEIPQVVIGKSEELGLLMLERSAGGFDDKGLPKSGYHLVFRRRAELSQVDNLKWASDLLGVQFDKAAKDITRVFFTTTSSDEDLLFLSEELFDNSSLDIEHSTLNIEHDHADTAQPNVQSSILNSQLNYHSLPYSRIIEKYWELYNDGHEPSQGDRNTKTYELAQQLAPICDYSQQQLEAVIPKYDGFSETEWRTTISNGLGDASKQISVRIERVLKALRSELRLTVMGGSVAADGTAQMPPLPEVLPPVLQLLSSRVPPKLKPMVVESVWPAVCAHVSGVTFRYTDGVPHEPNISSPLIGRQSIGKGHVNQPIEHLLADITARDRLNEDRLREWRRKNQGKGASKDRQPRPEDICIQRLDDDLTPAALSQSLIDAENNGHRRIITKVDEIEMLNKVGNGRNSDVALLVRYGFDTARWGQRRVGLESVNGSYAVRWVWNASCTPKALRRFLSANWIADGSLSRLNLNALLLSPDDREQPVVGEYDAQFDAQLKPYVELLNAASGQVDCTEATRLAKELQQEHAHVADLCDSEGYRVFSYRAVVIGWLKACLLYIMNGYRWDSSIETYVRYSVKRDMWLKMYYFGDQIEQEFQEEEAYTCHTPSDLLAPLPQRFTYDQYLQVRQAQGRKGDPRNALRVWKHRGYVEYDEATKLWVKKGV